MMMPWPAPSTILLSCASARRASTRLSIWRARHSPPPAGTAAVRCIAIHCRSLRRSRNLTMPGGSDGACTPAIAAATRPLSSGWTRSRNRLPTDSVDKSRCSRLPRARISRMRPEASSPRSSPFGSGFGISMSSATDTGPLRTFPGRSPGPWRRHRLSRSDRMSSDHRPTVKSTEYAGPIAYRLISVRSPAPFGPALLTRSTERNRLRLGRGRPDGHDDRPGRPPLSITPDVRAAVPVPRRRRRPDRRCRRRTWSKQPGSRRRSSEPQSDRPRRDRRWAENRTLFRTDRPRPRTWAGAEPGASPGGDPDAPGSAIPIGTAEQTRRDGTENAGGRGGAGGGRDSPGRSRLGRRWGDIVRHGLDADPARPGEAVAGEPHAAQESCGEPLEIGLHGDARILVEPAAGFDIELLARSQSLLEDIAVAVQPDHPFGAGRPEFIDEKPGPAEQDITDAFVQFPGVINIGGRGEELMLADMQLLAMCQHHREDLADAVAREGDLARSTRLDHEQIHAGDQPLDHAGERPDAELQRGRLPQQDVMLEIDGLADLQIDRQDGHQLAAEMIGVTTSLGVLGLGRVQSRGRGKGRHDRISIAGSGCRSSSKNPAAGRVERCSVQNQYKAGPGGVSPRHRHAARRDYHNYT